MIKKYFAMTIIASSVAMAACSSDDDDDDDGVVEGTPGFVAGQESCDALVAAGTTPPAECDPFLAEEEVTLTAEVSTPAVTAYDFIGTSTEHTTLLTALNANPALANAADDDTAAITVIAPDNAAFDTLVAATDGVTTPAELVALNEGADALRILQYHVIGSVVDITDTTEAQDTLLAGETDGTFETLSFQAGTAETAAVVDSSDPVSPVDLTVGQELPTGNVYSVASVLNPPVVEAGTGGEGGEGGGDINTAFPAEVQDGGANSTVGARMAADFSGQFTGMDSSVPGAATETAIWTFFVPVNSVDATAIVLADYIENGSGTAITDTTLTEGSTVTSATNLVYAVTNDGAGVITVGGATATFLGSTPGGGSIYSIDGLMTPN